ncbi:MAG: type 2 isopentenyl-diphosphate Delta-isomerase [Trueperaceae bacterium]|nr:type 2 isopentenyl-diphosphate Delta-isomerase [Trueperaceae bacterium]
MALSTDPHSPATLSRRKLKHVDVCLHEAVEYQTRTTGFERYDLPYTALPDTDLASIDTTTTFLGKPLRAPVLIGAMTGGAERSALINRNLALAAERLGIGLMLGSQRVMLVDERARASFSVRAYAPNALVIGNLGVAQLNRGYGAADIRAAIELIGADALALHTNPLQEAMQAGGDTDFRGLVDKLAEIVPQVGYPLLLKEVGHGLSGEVARSVKDVGFAALDVAGAGGTSWAKVEDIVRYGEVRHADLVEWGIPTATALREVRAALPDMPLIASGGIRSGVDAAKALALGAQVVAVARPLLKPATESVEAVVGWLEPFIAALKIAMHNCGAADLTALRARPLRARD